MIGQHIATNYASRNPTSTPDHYVGVICTQTNLDQVVQDAIANARMICEEHYGMFQGLYYSWKVLISGSWARRI